MFSNKLLVLFSLTVLTTCLAETIDLGTRGTFAIDVPTGWKLSSQAIPNQGVSVEIRPADETNAAMQLNVIFLPQAGPINGDKLEAGLLQLCEQFVSVSVEQKKTLGEFGTGTGFGKYCLFTDASLVGKPEQKGNFKFIAPGIVQQSEDTVVLVSLMGDDAAGPIGQAMFAAIASIRIKAAAAAPVTQTPVTAPTH